jgi:hypothetical protein
MRARRFHQVRRVGIGGSQQEVGGQGMAARRAASGAHDADPAFGQALFTQVPVPWRLAPVYEHHHVLVQAQPQIRIHLASEQRAAQVHQVHAQASIHTECIILWLHTHQKLLHTHQKMRWQSFLCMGSCAGLHSDCIKRKMCMFSSYITRLY